MPTTTTARTRRKSAPPTVFQPPIVPDPEPATPPKSPTPERETQPGKPTHYKGVEVVGDEPVGNLPGSPFRMLRLNLADGGIAYTCKDCWHTADTRGDIVTHRNREHGKQVGKRKPRIQYHRDTDPFDAVLPPRDDGSPAPGDLLDMSLREVVTLAPSLKAVFDLLDEKEREIAWLTEQLKANTIDKATRHKIEVYESHQTEIGELRATLAKQGNYDALKEEVYDLRAWKRKMITKLSQLGFQLSEEDQ